MVILSRCVRACVRLTETEYTRRRGAYNDLVNVIQSIDYRPSIRLSVYPSGLSIGQSRVNKHGYLPGESSSSSAAVTVQYRYHYYFKVN